MPEYLDEYLAMGGSGALTGALSGAQVGSVVPGVGTVAGGVVGGVIGLGAGLLSAKNTADVLAEEEARQAELEEALAGVDNLGKFASAVGATQAAQRTQARAMAGTEAARLGLSGAQQADYISRREGAIDVAGMTALAQAVPAAAQADIQEKGAILQSEVVQQELVNASLAAAGQPLEMFGAVAGTAAQLAALSPTTKAKTVTETPASTPVTTKGMTDKEFDAQLSGPWGVGTGTTQAMSMAVEPAAPVAAPAPVQTGVPAIGATEVLPSSARPGDPYAYQRVSDGQGGWTYQYQTGAGQWTDMRGGIAAVAPLFGEYFAPRALGQ